MSKKVFTVWCETPTFELTVEEIWPDDEPPENPTAQDVVEAMRNYGSVTRVVDEWMLDDEIMINVCGPEGCAEYQ